MIEFKAWPKIGRDDPYTVTITEKMDGTNACIIIEDGAVVGVQSRKRLITPEDDNYGFAGWVERNNDELLGLGDGYHYGEWAGLGIQKNPHGLKEKQFFLFNTFRWNPDNPNLPECCSVVRVLFQGRMNADTVDNLMMGLLLESGPGLEPEGVVVYYHAFRGYSKTTFKNSKGKWCNEGG